VALTATKAANDPQLLSHPPKEGWWTMAMVKSQILMVHWIHHNMSQGQQQQPNSSVYITLEP